MCTWNIYVKLCESIDIDGYVICFILVHRGSNGNGCYLIVQHGSTKLACPAHPTMICMSHRHLVVHAEARSIRGCRQPKKWRSHLRYCFQRGRQNDARYCEIRILLISITWLYWGRVAAGSAHTKHSFFSAHVTGTTFKDIQGKYMQILKQLRSLGWLTS